MHQYTQKVYNQTIDILRILSILAVICIHTTTRTLEASAYDLHNFPLTFLLNQSSRFAVSLFFMISGFVLELTYPFHANYIAYLKKRLSKIFVPYIFWSFIYFFFVYTQHTENFLTAILSGNASYQLYFIPTLLFFYTLFPFLHRYFAFISQRFSMIILGVVQIGLLYYDYFIHPLPFFYPLSVAFLNFYVFILGSIASHHEEKLMTIFGKWKIIFIAMTVICIGYVFFEGYNGYLKTHNYLAFYSQWRPSILVYTILLAGVLYYFTNKYVKYASFIKVLARLSFMVFFIHVIALEIIWYMLGKALFLAIHTSPLYRIWFDPFFFILTVILSFLFAFLIQKIPFIHKISG